MVQKVDTRAEKSISKFFHREDICILLKNVPFSSPIPPHVYMQED